MSSSRKRAPRRKIIGANWEAQRPRRGRPPADRPRKATRVYLTREQREHWLRMSQALAPLGAARIDIADLTMNNLALELGNIQSDLTGGDQVLPVGVVDLRSLYFLLDLRPPSEKSAQYTITMFTETRETMSVITVRLQSVFRTTWSKVFGLGIELLHQKLSDGRGRLSIVDQLDGLDDLNEFLFHPQQLEFKMR